MFQAEDTQQVPKLTPHQQLWRNVKVLPVKKKLQPDDFIEKTFSEYLNCHPTYMIPLIRAHNYILREIGPLNHVLRHFIAIMAASRHRCTYLINYSKKEFLFNGGDPEWLKGLQYVPPKIRALSQLNKILAHQPWLFQKSHIASLAKGQHGWTLSELTHAIIIMAHLHCLCTTAFGCKFGFAEPENFDDDDDNSVEVEIEELRFDPDCGSQKVKKVVKRSPASMLIAERCRQLELENATLAKFMNIKTREKYNKPQREPNPNRERLVKQDSIGSTGRSKKNKENKADKQGSSESLNSEHKVNPETSTSKPVKNGGNRSRKSSNTNSASSSVSNSPSSSSGQSIMVTSSNTPLSTAVTNTIQSNNTTSRASAMSTSVSPSVGGGAVVKITPPPSPSNTEETSSSNLSDFKVNTWSEDEFKRQHYDVLVDDGEFCYVDFSSRGRPAEVSTFRFQDYGWDDEGYGLCNLLYPDISSYLDEKFKVGYNLTYYTLGPKTNIDTSPFRRAVWNYIQCIYGMRHDDYNYREVNILLERNLKCFIKCLACYPDQVVKHDFSDVMKGFRASEKIHVIIMVTEARLQCELLYALRSITEFMKGTT